MARTKKSPTKINIIDQLCEKLSETGVEFVRDAWQDKAPEDYGVVELNGAASQLWADGHLLDELWSVTVTLYVAGDDDAWPKAVQQKLEELEADGRVDLTHTISRAFEPTIGKVRWTWQVSMYGELEQDVTPG